MKQAIGMLAVVWLWSADRYAKKSGPEGEGMAIWNRRDIDLWGTSTYRITKTTC